MQPPHPLNDLSRKLRTGTVRCDSDHDQSERYILYRNYSDPEEDLHPIVAEAITESYFTEWGTRADGLRADFTQVLKIDFRF
ncbi:hypothetical protein ACFXGT_20165 [Streptomyces sp. NPDC059352]|uniref:hypothetical protein n=1 Tax=Streptomyces sp. NPDC059352 TaxID=3346810 RepID=UPI0036B34E6D